MVGVTVAGWSKDGPTRGAGGASELHPLDRLHLAWRLFRDPRVSPRLKTIVPALCALYVLSPIDLIPDVFIGLGQMDDVGFIGLMMAVLTLALRFAPRQIVAEHLAAMGLRTDDATARPNARTGTGPVMEAHYRVRR